MMPEASSGWILENMFTDQALNMVTIQLIIKASTKLF